jgi:hypothetical protein
MLRVTAIAAVEGILNGTSDFDAQDKGRQQ